MTTSRARRGLHVALVVGAVAAGFGLALPRAAGAPWSELAAGLAAVPYADLALLGLLWIVGLGLHTFVLTAALPRLTHRRALTLSLTGSAVANVLPLGGAAGVALNYRMARSWGFTPASMATYTLLTNIWDVLAKLCVPLVALGWLLLSGTAVAGTFLTTTLGATIALVLVAAGVGLVLAHAGAARRVGAALDRLLPRARLGTAVVRLQADSSVLVARAWPRLTAGMIAYTASLALLLWLCLHLTGAGLAAPAVFAGFAVERLLTLAGLTPGGSGVVEVGLSGLLLLLGGDPVGVVTGVLLYRAFTFGLEIPVGGVGLAVWLWHQRKRVAPVSVS